MGVEKGGIFWEGGVNSGRVAHRCLKIGGLDSWKVAKRCRKGGIFWEGGVDSGIRRHLT